MRANICAAGMRVGSDALVTMEPKPRWQLITMSYENQIEGYYERKFHWRAGHSPPRSCHLGRSVHSGVRCDTGAESPLDIAGSGLPGGRVDYLVSGRTEKTLSAFWWAVPATQPCAEQTGQPTCVNPSQQTLSDWSTTSHFLSLPRFTGQSAPIRRADNAAAAPKPAALHPKAAILPEAGQEQRSDWHIQMLDGQR